MNKQNVLIFKLPDLFDILNELKNHLDFAIHSFVEKDKLLEFKKTNTGSYLILTDTENEIKEEKSQLILNNSGSLKINTFCLFINI